MNEGNGFSTSGILVSFFLGGVAGAAIALLFAPRSGEETRDLINDRFREQVERTREGTARLVSKGQEIIDGTTGYIDKQKKSLEHQKDRVATAVEAGRQSYRDGKEV